MIASPFRWSLLLSATALASMLTACDTKSDTAPLSGKIAIDGSDTIYPLSKAMAEGFRTTHPGVQTTVDFSGTGGGFKKFCSGQLDITGASRPIRTDESAQCKAQGVKFMEVPVAFDSLSVVVNTKNTFVDCLTTAELKAMWEPSAQGKITTWNQIRPSFPAQPLALFGPSKDNGTFDYFTFAINKVESSSRSDYIASTDYSAVARGVAADQNALGYFGYAYYQANKDQLKLVAVDSGRGCVLPSPKTVVDGSYQPLTRPLFIYVTEAAAKRPEVKALTHFYLGVENTSYVTNVGYVPLPIVALVNQARRFDKGVVGSFLGGHGSVTGVELSTFDDDQEKERVRNLLVQ